MLPSVSHPLSPSSWSWEFFLRIKTRVQHEITSTLREASAILRTLSPLPSPHSPTHPTTHPTTTLPASHTQRFKFNLTVFHHYVTHTHARAHALTLAHNNSVCVFLCASGASVRFTLDSAPAPALSLTQAVAALAGTSETCWPGCTKPQPRRRSIWRPC